MSANSVTRLIDCVFASFAGACPVLKGIVCVLVASQMVSCAAPKRDLSQQDLSNGYIDYVTEYQSELTALETKGRNRLKQEYRKQDDKTQSYDVLVLSGGGELGAFGAGFLKGWGQVTDDPFARPEFDSVSGISTGALIAPFAYAGTEESYSKIIDLYRSPDDDLAIARPILSFLLGNRSFYDVEQLHSRIRQSITADLVRSLAEGSLQNRTLMVGATNIDYGTMRVWDLSRIAEQMPEEDAAREIADRLIASSAIPAAFPPVNIDDYLYVDGGASMQVVSGLENRSWLYRQKADEIDFIDLQEPLQIRIWVVINNKLLIEPEVISPTWSAIATRSLVSLMRASTLQTLQDIESYIQLINLRPDFEAQMHYVAIPQDYEIPETRNLFDAKKMSDLIDLGERMGADPGNWKTRALRPGAPVVD